LADKYPSLSTLPASCRPEEPFALTRLISNQDSRNIILVAEDAGNVVGFAVATCDVDVQLLQESFELHPYDGFLAEPLYTALDAAARETVIARKQWEGGMGDSSGAGVEAGARKVSGEGGVQEGYGPSAAGTCGNSSHRGQELSLAAAAGVVMAAGRENTKGEVEVTSEELRHELLPLLAAALAEDEHRHTLFAVTMLCMKEENEQQAIDFLGPMFEAFTDKVSDAKLHHSLHSRAGFKLSLQRLFAPLMSVECNAFLKTSHQGTSSDVISCFSCPFTFSSSGILRSLSAPELG
jgi:hypothetical protein